VSSNTNPAAPADTPANATDTTETGGLKGSDSKSDPTGTPTEDTTEDGESRGGNHEAAKYRVRLRETETERDALAARLATSERSVIDHAIAAAGIDPRLWELSGIDLNELRTETGALDIAATVDRARAIRAEVYGAGPRPNPQQGTPSQRPGNSLAEAFNPNR